MLPRITARIVFSALLAGAPALAQNPPPEPAAPPAATSRADEIDARYDQADRLIRQIKTMRAGPERSAAIEELRRALTQIDDAYTDEEKADHARRTIDALRAAVSRQRQRLTETGMAMAQAKNAQPPDPAAVQVAGSDYTIQEAILKALEVKLRQTERSQAMGTSEALRLMQEVE
ncbi:MAG: hypothetical protein AB7V22_03235 [Kiritimatiellia bacterium]